MEIWNIVEVKQRIYKLLQSNSFEKKLNSREPFTFSYVKRGQTYELKIKFPSDDYNDSPMVVVLSLHRFDLKSELIISYDIFLKSENNFIELIQESLSKQLTDFILKEIQEDLK